jgi:hypothetical protein
LLGGAEFRADHSKERNNVLGDDTFGGSGELP